MPLTVAERERVRYHLGYPNVHPAAALTYGMVKPVQTLFLVESSIDKLLEDTVDRVRRILGIMDGIETKLTEAQDRLAANSLGDIQLRESEPDQLEREYMRWGMRLSDILGAPPYYLSPRYRGGGGVAIGNIPVR